MVVLQSAESIMVKGWMGAAGAGPRFAGGVGFGFGLELGLYGCAVGVCAVVPWAVPEGAEVDCATATVDSVAARANATATP